MKTSTFYLLLVIGVGGLLGCEQEYTPIPSGEVPDYVVEGYIEAGQDALPAYLILTRSFDFYGEISSDQFNASFVHDAQVKISEGSNSVSLTEICFSELDSATLHQVSGYFGFDPDSLSIDFCVYIDLLNQLQPKAGGTYHLQIAVNEDTVTAVTTIPQLVPIDSMMFQPPPGEPNDTLAQLMCYVSDPPGVMNYYRYLGSTNGGALEPAFSSVTEDLFFDGKSFGFQLFNPQTVDGDSDPEEFGLYFVGDTITVKWCAIDEATFNFWNTLEYAKSNQGPFSSYTRIQSNIVGGLGTWGGYNVRYYTRKVEY